MTRRTLVEALVMAWLLHFLGRGWAQYTAIGEIDAENYKYFRVFMEGNIRLELHSISGDADLYVSDTSDSPTVSEYDLSSASCGLDVVEIPSTFRRPLGVAVYAYPSYLNCSFVLSVFKLPDSEETDLWENNFEALYASYDSGNPFVEQPKTHLDKDSMPQSPESSDNEPFWWKLLITLLKIIVDAAL